MIIRNVSELRLYFPTHAIDSNYSFSGGAYNSEIDFLKDKLGDKLYDKLNTHLADINTDSFIDKIESGESLGYYEQLLYMAQRCVAFDMMGRTASLNAVSLNGMGVNVATSVDYGKADKQAIDDFKSTCIKEAHTAINILLATLESWTIASKNSTDNDLKEIVADWKDSKYYYFANSLFIPSAVVMQEYLNFYENREKFIQMLPDLKYIQEELIEPLLGSDFSEYLLANIKDVCEDKVLNKLINLLRKFMAASLEARTQVIRINANRVNEAHSEAIAYTNKITDYVTSHLDVWLASTDTVLVDAIKLTPEYIARKDTEAKAQALATAKQNPFQQADALFMPMPGLK